MACVLAANSVTGTDKDASMSLKTQYLNSRTPSEAGSYKTPTLQELAAFNILVDSILDHCISPVKQPLGPLKTAAQTLGFRIKRVDDSGGKTFIILAEAEELHFGGGFYAFSESMSGSRPILIQTPHARSDAYTGRLGCAVARHADIDAFFSSTMRRNRETRMDQDNQIEELSDPAHNSQTFFHAATKAFAARCPDLLLIQLHGFKPTPGRRFDLILSSGSVSSKPSMPYSQVETLIRTTFETRKVAVFGKDIDELGALTNIQGQLVNLTSSGMFLHIEMSLEFREWLMNSDTQRTGLFRCIDRVKSAYANGE
jgi:hypothetical protein